MVLLSTGPGAWQKSSFDGCVAVVIRLCQSPFTARSDVDLFLFESPDFLSQKWKLIESFHINSRYANDREFEKVE